jgi:hypothetical protein
MVVRILTGDCREVLPTLPDRSVQCVVTSPPYWGLRDYGVAGQIGNEATVDEWVDVMVAVFREVKRVLRDDGTVWLNLGDAYARSPASGGERIGRPQDKNPGTHQRTPKLPWKRPDGLKPKDLIGMPWMVAFALQADGWYLRSDIIWCLSGGTRVYAKTQKGEMPMSIKDMVRLDPATVQLWNGQKWTQVLGWNESPRPETPIELELRSGEKIGCTHGHQWPTQRGLVRADELRVGDVIEATRLPDMGPGTGMRFNGVNPYRLDAKEIGWLVGLYLAEGSRSGDHIQIASHTGQVDRFGKVESIVRSYHGTARMHQTSENGATINVHGPIIGAIIDTYIAGDSAQTKHLNVRCWQRSDEFLAAVLDGYLHGDGHWDEKNKRYRLGFCCNDALAADLRTLCARLGYSLRLKRAVHQNQTGRFPGWRGEVRTSQSNHHNTKQSGEVVAIGRSRARKFWDIGVEDEPHLFALASGVLTHNSKPNPMPESVRDRPTSAHEHVFLLTKRPRYFYDADAVRLPALSDRPDMAEKGLRTGVAYLNGNKDNAAKPDKQRGHGRRHDGFNDRWDAMSKAEQQATGANLRNVWTIATHPFPEAHFATFPPALVEPCIKAGTSEKGCCDSCGAPWVRVVERERVPDTSARATTTYTGQAYAHPQSAPRGPKLDFGPGVDAKTTGWSPSCSCDAAIVPCVVLDPFGGAGTTGLVADRLGRDAVLVELNPSYVTIGATRVTDDAPLFAAVEVKPLA